jgi:hypothetical protein
MRLSVLLFVLLAACNGSGSSDPMENGPDAGMDDGSGSGSGCVPKTCAQRGAECGASDDGCGHELDCGYCLYASDRCEDNRCECQPSCVGTDCGDDGCGGSCGTCDANETCTYYGCVWEGAHTTPPADWLCSAARYDTGDGCDCNCGALDPDCEGPHQSLHGCTGLDHPTCDAEGLCTGGGTCHAVPGGAYLTHYMVIQTAPTMSGGTVKSGRWEGTDMRSYNPPGGVSGYGGGDGVAIEISGTTWKRTRLPVGGYPTVFETFTASFSGNTVTLTRTCPSASTETYTYTASSTQITLSQAAGSGRKNIVFTKRW